MPGHQHGEIQRFLHLGRDIGREQVPQRSHAVRRAQPDHVVIHVSGFSDNFTDDVPTPVFQFCGYACTIECGQRMLNVKRLRCGGLQDVLLIILELVCRGVVQRGGFRDVEQGDVRMRGACDSVDDARYSLGVMKPPCAQQDSPKL